jgi:hypothetical protein
MRNVVANPEEKRRNYHVSLTDNVTSIGLIITDAAGHARPKSMSRNPAQRTALKTRSGEMKFDSFNEPWSPIAQESWLGGRANLEFDKDNARFLDSFRANTQYGYFSNGPLETYATGIRTTSEELPGSVKFIPIKDGDYLFFATKRNIVTMTAKYLYLILKRKGTPPADLTITIRSDAAGLPDVVLKTITITTTDITDVVSEYRRMEIPSTYGFTTGTAIWVELTTTSADEDNYWSVGAFDKAASTAKSSADGITWVNAPYEIYFRVTPADDADVQCKQFKYRYAEYIAMSINGAATNLYMNGDRGMADSNVGHLDQVIDSVKAWPTDKHKGKIVKIIAGPGSTEWTNWRVITSNDDSHLNVSPNWIETHTSATEYLILGSDDFIQITTTGKLTKPVDYDPLVINNFVYFPQGDATNLQRMVWNATTAVHDIVDDGTNKATILQQCRDATNGLEIWRGQNSDATGLISVSKAPVVDSGNLTFEAVIPLKDERGRITGIEEYGDTTKVPWVMREGSIYQIVSNKPDEIPLREIATMMDTSNGRAHLVHNVYLYFNYGQGIERYYDKTLDDVGPNRDQGLPADRKGVVSCMVGYPGRYFASIDADATGYSSVLVNNLTGWHEVYRAPAIGQRIRSMDFQTVPGAATDRLWVNVGNDIISLNFPSGGLDPLNDTACRYVWESTITGSRMYVSMYDVIKFFRSFKLFADGLSDGQTVEMDYRMDEDTAWSTCPGAFDGDVRELFPIENYGVNGISLSYRLRILTDDSSKTVRGKALVLNNISRVPVKYSYGLPYRVVEYDVDLYGKQDTMDVEEKQQIIDDWATQLTPLIMNCQYKLFDNKVVFIDPIPLNPLAEKQDRYLGKLVIVEI